MQIRCFSVKVLMESIQLWLRRYTASENTNGYMGYLFSSITHMPKSSKFSFKEVEWKFTEDRPLVQQDWKWWD